MNVNWNLVKEKRRMGGKEERRKGDLDFNFL
jgi:hypothetical protein